VNTSIQYNAAGQNTNAAAGQMTAARNPRVMQLALRIVFRVLWRRIPEALT
jgi:hypothetical protein